MSLFRKIVPAVDTEPGITDPSYEEMFLPPDPTLEAVAPTDRDLLDILEEISSNTRGNNDDPGIVWQHVFSRLPASSGESSLLASERVRNIYIPNVPRNVSVYSGSSRGLLLGNLVAGETLQAELPYYTNGVFLVYESGDSNEQINVYLSSKAIDISVRPANEFGVVTPTPTVTQRNTLTISVPAGQIVYISPSANAKRIVVRISTVALYVMDMNSTPLAYLTTTSAEFVTFSPNEFMVYNPGTTTGNVLIYEEV